MAKQFLVELFVESSVETAMSKTNKMSKEAEEEREHFKKVVDALNNYRRDSKERLARAYTNLKNIPLEHQKLLAKHGHQANLQQLDSCIELNMAIISEITSDAESMFENQVTITHPLFDRIASERYKITCC